MVKNADGVSQNPKMICVVHTPKGWGKNWVRVRDIGLMGVRV